jgi:hypothetical protein
MEVRADDGRQRFDPFLGATHAAHHPDTGKFATPRPTDYLSE